MMLGCFVLLLFITLLMFKCTDLRVWVGLSARGCNSVELCYFLHLLH